MYHGRISIVPLVAFTLIAGSAQAQVLGTYRWNVAPYCSVMTLTVTHQSGIFTLDGFEDQCGGNPRLPVAGIAVPQVDGGVLLGITSVTSTGSAIHTRAAISLTTLGGGWQDDAGSSGTFVFNPGPTSGGPRPGPVSTALPSAFLFNADGGFAARGQEDVGGIPASGAGVRAMWYPAKGAFRAGHVTDTQWDDANVGDFSVALGHNTRATSYASVALGNETLASGGSSTAMGFNAVASGGSSVAMGSITQAVGSSALATGSNTIAHHFGTAMGYFASTNGFEGSFVYGDRSASSYVTNTATNQFVARAANGYRFYTNAALTQGVAVAPGGGSWASVSDANMKTEFRDLDGDAVLAKLTTMPIREWSYTAQDTSIRHVGPTAQDFHAAFGLGEDPLKITTVDADGIALRAIQALTTQIAALRARLAELEALARR